MKKTTYALCGTALVLAATTLRTLADGGPELVLVLLLGLVLLLASVDAPARHGR